MSCRLKKDVVKAQKKTTTNGWKLRIRSIRKEGVVELEVDLLLINSSCLKLRILVTACFDMVGKSV